jgi:6,7-dimethyl-8-ribityllumazine synthase
VAEYRGLLRADGKRFGIVAARFNETVTEHLLAGAREGFRQLGIAEDAVDVAWVPGALEVVLVAQRMAASGRYAGLICLGAVIRGETSHFDYVAGQCAAGVAAAARETGVPILFGVLTTDTVEQALNRAGLKSGNKGYECALGAVEMASLLEQLG